MSIQILCIAGPTASGKSARGVDEALRRGGEVISVDSRQVYRTLDIGTEKMRPEDMQGVPHHLIDIREPEDGYSAGDFVQDAERLVSEIKGRGNLPMFVGGTHFYFDALFNGLPQEAGADASLRQELEELSTEALYARVCATDPKRGQTIEAGNRRRLIRALEIIALYGHVTPRKKPQTNYEAEWIILDPSSKELKDRIDRRLTKALTQGLIEEVERTQKRVGDRRLNELGLEYKVVGAYLRGEVPEASLLPMLSAKIWQYARRQKAWLRKLQSEIIEEESLPQDKN